MKKISILLVTLMAITTVVSAQSKKDLTNRLDSLELKIADLKDYSHRVASYSQRLEEEITGIKKNQSKFESDLKTTNTKIQVLENGLSIVMDDIDTIKTQLKEYKDLRAYVNEKLSWLKNTVKQGEAKHQCFGSEADNFDVFFIGPFASGSTSLTNGMKTSLQKVVAILKDTVKNKEIMEIDGFASIDGPSELNDSLSLQRATAVATFLEKKEVTIPKNGIKYLGGTVRYGTPIDNRCVVIFAAKK